MKNKQTFELPNYMSSSPNNSVNFSEKRRKIQEHLEILEDQEFCLSLERFFNHFPDIEELMLTAERDMGNFNLIASFKGSGPVIMYNNIEVDDFISSNLSTKCLQDLEGWEFTIKKDNIKAAWAEWMGDENYQKWNAQVTEEKLLKIVDNEANQPKQKIKRI